MVDLLFNLETERNVSAFLTNAMFLDLVERGYYTIKDLPNKLPMAMKGAVDASRSNQAHLTLRKSHKFDFKKSADDAFSILEFNLKNIVLLLDWLATSNNSIAIDCSDIKSIIGLLPTIREVSSERTKRKVTQLTEEEEPEHFEVLLNQLMDYQPVKRIIDDINQSPNLLRDSNKAKNSFKSKIEQLIQTQCEIVNQKIIENSNAIKTMVLQLVESWYNIDLSYLTDKTDETDQISQPFAAVNLDTNHGEEVKYHNDNDAQLLTSLSTEDSEGCGSLIGCDSNI